MHSFIISVLPGELLTSKPPLKPHVVEWSPSRLYSCEFSVIVVKAFVGTALPTLRMLGFKWLKVLNVLVKTNKLSMQ